MKAYQITNKDDAIKFMERAGSFAYIFADDGIRLGDVLGGAEIIITNEYSFTQQFFANGSDAWYYISGRIVENPIIVVPC